MSLQTGPSGAGSSDGVQIFAEGICLSGAGTQEANGVYRATSKMYCGAPIYEHIRRAADFKITREPHENPKTGKVKHGWLLGQQKAPLYGVPTEALAVPVEGWKKFGGTMPLPIVRVHVVLSDALFELADEAKRAGDAASEAEDWAVACSSYTLCLETLKSCSENDWKTEACVNRAASALSRRAAAELRAAEPRLALRDAVAALDLIRSLASAELIVADAMQALGCTDASGQRLLQQLGQGQYVDPTMPLALRCIERWLDATLPILRADKSELPLPCPTHYDSDRYLDGVDDTTRQEVIQQFVPESCLHDGGVGLLTSAQECLELMRRWEDVFSSEDFQRRRQELWDRKGLSFPVRLRETKDLVASSLTGVLVPMGYAPGRPGLARVVKQMQQFWSHDQACASKALDLEDLADISLADLE